MQCEFIKGCLTGTMTGNFCFKSSWTHIQQEKLTPNEDTTNNRCDNDICKEKSQIHPQLASTFIHASESSKIQFLDVMLTLWKESTLLSSSQLQLIDKIKLLHTFEPPKDGDISLGPCLLGPTLNLNSKNKTCSVCLLCECLAAHPDARGGLNLFKNDILSSIDNNVKLIDRISFLINTPESLTYIKDEFLRAIIKGCSSQQIHKHLFCDPLCAINSEVISTDILFNVPQPQELHNIKAALAIGTYLSKNSLFDCDLLHTLVTIFKCIQVCKVGKTTFLEIVKEIDIHLKKHHLFVIQSLQTAQVYT